MLFGEGEGHVLLRGEAVVDQQVAEATALDGLLLQHVVELGRADDALVEQAFADTHRRVSRSGCAAGIRVGLSA